MKDEIEAEITKIGNLMRNTGWTREKAMRMLGVSFAD